MALSSKLRCPITGSSTGFGRAMTELVLANGDIAVATLRTPSALDELTTKYSKDKLLVLKLDVAKPEETKAAFAAALAHFGRIDAVFNNAAYSIFGEAEAMSDAVAREMFDVNLWGAIAVSKEAIRVFREVNQPAGGRLLNVSSSAGIDPVPGLAHYGAAKSALIAFTEGLAKEVDPAWNIKIIVVAPGAFSTPALSKITPIPPHPAYEKQLATTRALFSMDYFPGMQDPVKGVEVLYRIAALPDPPVFLPLGVDAVEMAKKKSEERAKAIEVAAPWSEELRVEPSHLEAINA
ncbi:NAD-binding protein [Fomitopsis schrenkii]|uniref:NAD-binding protein n=1 Tax=Fomitopsis schrenkii TaxID=2126942 RepID=S8EDR3_FOMSC|nr:NAD-binding protein [Fomitopsis schrenkii]